MTGLVPTDGSVSPLMMLSSASLLAAAKQLRETEVPHAMLKNGVTVTPEQLEAAAAILRGAEPSQITNVSGSLGGSVNFNPQERPGFIDAARQDDPLVVSFIVGIIPSTTYRIDRVGTVLSEATP